jgi:hypothetical protein
MTNWHEQVYFGLHFDLHAQKNDPELYRQLTVDEVESWLKNVRPDWLQCDCKGHPGYCSWPTRLGSSSDGLVTDGLAVHREATRRVGIPLGVHYSGVWDSRAIELHPEWARIDRNQAADPHSTCNRSGYTQEFMIPHLLEIVGNYEVDGIWVDGECWAAKPCWCERCQTDFTADYGVLPPANEQSAQWRDWLNFHRQSFIDHVKLYVDAVHQAFPNCMVCSNWLYSARHPEKVTVAVDYLSGDFDAAWGAARAATESRMLDGRHADFGLSWDLMLWSFAKFYSTPAPISHVMKPLIQMQQEAAEVLAHGGAIMLYDMPERSGLIAPWRQRRYAALRDWVYQHQPFCVETVSASTVAVLHLADHHQHFATRYPAQIAGREEVLYDAEATNQAMEGALHALLECGFSADVITQDSLAARLTHYQLVVVPEAAHISDDVLSNLKEYVAAGGNLFFSGLLTDERLSQWFGVKTGRTIDDERVCLQVGEEAVALPTPWSTVELPADGAVVPVARRLDGFCPVVNQTPEIVVVERQLAGGGVLLGAFGNVFREYYLGHYPLLRQLLAEWFERFPISWNARIVEGWKTPYVELVTRRRGDNLYLHLINRGARETLGANRGLVSEVAPATSFTVRFAREVVGLPCRALNDQQACPVQISGDTMRVPRLDLYEIFILEKFFTP